MCSPFDLKVEEQEKENNTIVVITKRKQHVIIDLFKITPPLQQVLQLKDTIAYKGMSIALVIISSLCLKKYNKFEKEPSGLRLFIWLIHIQEVIPTQSGSPLPLCPTGKTPISLPDIFLRHKKSSCLYFSMI